MMKLNELKIQSFVTGVEKREEILVNGGIKINTGPLACPTSPTSPEAGCC